MTAPTQLGKEDGRYDQSNQDQATRQSGTGSQEGIGADSPAYRAGNILQELKFR